MPEQAKRPTQWSARRELLPVDEPLPAEDPQLPVADRVPPRRLERRARRRRRRNV